MENLPTFISAAFVLITIGTIYLLYMATQQSKTVLTLALVWLTIVGALGLSGFYTNTSAVPPRLIFLIGPPLIVIAATFFTPQGKLFIDLMDMRFTTYLHVVRIPVEFILLGLFMYKYVPQLMTFEGRNFDIFSGLTASAVAYWGFTKNRLSKTLLLLWNFVCLGLLLNVVGHAILAAPTPFQKLAFDQPNVGVLHFPFVWLPAFIVPAVLFCHLVAIRRLLTTVK